MSKRNRIVLKFFVPFALSLCVASMARYKEMGPALRDVDVLAQRLLGLGQDHGLAEAISIAKENTYGNVTQTLNSDHELQNDRERAVIVAAAWALMHYTWGLEPAEATGPLFKAPTPEVTGELDEADGSPEDAADDARNSGAPSADAVDGHETVTSPDDPGDALVQAATEIDSTDPTARPSEVLRPSWFLDTCYRSPEEQSFYTWFRIRSECQLTWVIFLQLLVIGPLVLVFPGLMMASYVRAKRRLEASDSPEFARFSDEVRHRRDLRIALRAEESGGRWRLWVFAMMITGGVLYLFSPLGLKASLVSELATMNSQPGGLSFPAWTIDFADSPPLMYGFAGFYLYCLMSFLRRYHRKELDASVFLPLGTRGFTVLILSLVLWGMFGAAPGTSALVFLSGLFPSTGLLAINKAAAGLLQGQQVELNQRSLSGLRAVDLWKEQLLREVGIDSVYELAAADWEALIAAVGIHPQVLLNAAGEAFLRRELSEQQVQSLAAFGITSVGDLLAQRHERSEQIKTALSLENLDAFIARLLTYKKIQFLVQTARRYGHGADDDTGAWMVLPHGAEETVNVTADRGQRLDAQSKSPAVDGRDSDDSEVAVDLSDSGVDASESTPTDENQ